MQITSYPKYQNYKPSGVQWLGEIPEHWKITKLRNIGVFSASGIDKYLKNNESKVKIINFTDVYANKSMTLDSSFYYMVVTTPESNRIKHLVKKGDLIFLPSSETYEDLGAAALVNEELENTSFSYHVIRLVFQKEIDHSYRKYLTNNAFVLNQFSRQGKGTTRKIIGRGVFKDVQVIIPPLPEQTAIANFLDRKTALIDQAIGIKQKQIELLKERRQILIHKAVTRGINPNVRMKPSGVEWIGEIPEGWEVKRLRYIANCFPSNIDKHSKANEQEVRLCNYTDVYKNDYITDDMELMIATASNEQINKFTLIEGDIVVTKDSETASDIAVPAYIKEPLSNVVCGYHLAIIRTYQSSYSKYLFQALKTKLFNAQFEVCSNGITRVGLGNSDLKNGYFLLPSEQEQIEISKYIESATTKIATAISLKEQEIERLREYKATLIDGAVTGKIKVS
jgi:type I restriction enzyme S subunit